MKKLSFVLLTFLLAVYASAQDPEVENLRKEISRHSQQDTFRVNRLNELANSGTLQQDEIAKLATEALTISRNTGYAIGEAYALLNMGYATSLKGNRQEANLLVLQADSIAQKVNDRELLINVLMKKSLLKVQTNENKEALAYEIQAEDLAQKTGNKKLLSICQEGIANIYMNSFSAFPKAMEYALKSINAGEDANCLQCLAQSWRTMAALYNFIGDQHTSLVYYEKAVEANKKLGNKQLTLSLLNNIGERYRLMGKYPEAIKVYKESLEGQPQPYYVELTESNMADAYVRIDSLTPAFYYCFKSLKIAKEIGDIEGDAWISSILSRAYLKKKMPDSAIYYSLHGLAVAKQTGTIEFMRDNAEALANAYAFKNDFKNAYSYYALYISYRDSMLNSEVSNKSMVLQYNYDLEKKQAQITALNQQKKSQQNFLTSSLIVLLLIVITVIILLRNNRQKLHANKLLRKQKQEIEDQRDQTNKALAELQETQKQLIQAEKMASLGELTAGIAHEIQNPLNFVNNFSDVNNELITELVDEVDKGNIDAAKMIAKDIKDNEEKINHHGKRAESIVKSMLQHSRQSSGLKEPTDINALCDEYLRLSYHGLRAKNKSFNADFKTFFDTSLDKINIVRQDMGRVFLNLFNNAFYTVNEKSKNLAGLQQYQPTVSVQTKKINDNIEIIIKDNGNGIPQNIVDKIFQPFFTTKPTGKGTGLGLSLSYDIITKHNGTIKAQSKEGEGTEFVISLPLIA